MTKPNADNPLFSPEFKRQCDEAVKQLRASLDEMGIDELLAELHAECKKSREKLREWFQAQRPPEPPKDVSRRKSTEADSTGTKRPPPPPVGASDAPGGP